MQKENTCVPQTVLRFLGTVRGRATEPEEPQTQASEPEQDLDGYRTDSVRKLQDNVISSTANAYCFPFKNLNHYLTTNKHVY